MKHYYECLLDLPVQLLEDSYEYISRSDAAHNEEHIRAVVKEADRLIPEDMSDRLRMYAVAAALMHDLGCAVRNGRDRHEIYSAQIARGLIDDCGVYMETAIIIPAILQHRGSFTGKRTGRISDIVAAADRGRPNAAVLFLRAYIYAKEINDVSHDVAVQHAIRYNKAKFGYDGYARMRDNTLIMKYYPEESVAIEKIFEEATVETVEASLRKFGETS